jgi:hypothetical protein
MRTCRSLLSLLTTGVTAAAVIAGCYGEADPEPEITGIQLAKPATLDPQVTATDPPGAPQDTTLDVEVSGSGFDDGSTVALTLGGVPTDKVRTNSTRYRNPKTLIANVTIAPDADLDLYDVEVTTASRKKGIGTEMFEVFLAGENEVLVEFKQTASADLTSFFSSAVTLDFTSERQRVQGKHNENSIETKSTPFTLSLEPSIDFFDARDRNDARCATGYLDTLLIAAAGNGGALSGWLEISAQWDHPITSVIAVHFRVEVGEYEYQMSIPLGGDSGVDRVILPGDPYTVLALRNGHFDIRRRERGRKGTWWEMERCYITTDPPNGLVEFEAWVWR